MFNFLYSIRNYIQFLIINHNGKEYENVYVYWWLSGKESACNAGDLDLIHGLGKSPGGGHGNPLQYSCLQNPMERGAWWATVHWVTKSQT